MNSRINNPIWTPKKTATWQIYHNTDPGSFLSWQCLHKDSFFWDFEEYQSTNIYIYIHIHILYYTLYVIYYKIYIIYYIIWLFYNIHIYYKLYVIYFKIYIILYLIILYYNIYIHIIYTYIVYIPMPSRWILTLAGPVIPRTLKPSYDDRLASHFPHVWASVHGW